MGGATSGAETRSYGLGNRSRPRRRPSAGTLELASAYRFASERARGFEPLTSSLGSWHSTTELRPQVVVPLGLTSSRLVAFVAVALLVALKTGRCSKSMRLHGFGST